MKFDEVVKTGNLTKDNATLDQAKSFEKFCPNCHTWEKTFVVKKRNKNHERYFSKCRCENSFRWLCLDSVGGVFKTQFGSAN